MAVYESFKKDWEKTKKEMKELGQKKPAEIKKHGIWILKVEERVSSGIGKALKALDAAESKGAKAYEAALKQATTAIDSELQAINAEVDKYRGEDKKVDKDLKDGNYRALKVFKSKLLHYVAAAEQQLKEMEPVGNNGGAQAMEKFKAKCKQLLLGAAAAVKKVGAKPTAENYEECVQILKDALAEIKNGAEAFVKERLANNEGNVQQNSADVQQEAWTRLYYGSMKLPARSSSNFPTKPEEIKDYASQMNKLIKDGIKQHGKLKYSA